MQSQTRTRGEVFRTRSRLASTELTERENAIKIDRQHSQQHRMRMEKLKTAEDRKVRAIFK